MTSAWQIVAGPITLLLIARWFTPEAQGFYYTFASLLALQSFVELGFFLVIINVASHEWAHLQLDHNGTIIGDQQALSRLISLGQFIFKWYAVASTAFVVVVGIIGWVFFSQAPNTKVEWQGPWLATVVLTGFLLWTLPFNALLEGCGQIAIINRYRTSQAVLGSLALWITIALGGGLWAAAVALGVRTMRDLYLLLIRYRRFFAPFLFVPPGPGINWRTEIWPMQWRLAVAGIVNYFAFWLFTPVMFRAQGATVAGQMGMTLAVIAALQGLAMAWVQAKVPSFGVMIARKEWDALNRVFFRTLVVSGLVMSVGAVVLWLLVYVVNEGGYFLAERLLPPLPTGLLLLAAIVVHVSGCESAYLRAHKQEPIMVLNVSASIAIGLLVWFLGSRFGPAGAAASYLGVFAGVVLPWQTWIWFRCRAAWHQA